MDKCPKQYNYDLKYIEDEIIKMKMQFQYKSVTNVFCIIILNTTITETFLV